MSSDDTVKGEHVNDATEEAEAPTLWDTTGDERQSGLTVSQ